MHYLQHEPFEALGVIADWAAERGHDVSSTLLYDTSREGGRFPDPAEFDLLVIMGGSMNIYEHEAYPWLPAEKAFIAASIEAGKAVLGICLGSQLVADVLGGPVVRNARREIGWFPVQLTPGLETPVFSRFPAGFTTLHYHGDTFAIPPGAVHVASSAACANQAFAYAGGRVVGLQFHPEVSRASLGLLVEKAPPPVSPDEPWVQTAEELLAPAAPFEAGNALLYELLDRMLATLV
jgi:GMP synthase-like glutamine amidotransferase